MFAGNDEMLVSFFFPNNVGNILKITTHGRKNLILNKELCRCRAKLAFVSFLYLFPIHRKWHYSVPFIGPMIWKCKYRKSRIRHILIFYFGSQNTGQVKWHRRAQPSTNCLIPREVLFRFPSLTPGSGAQTWKKRVEPSKPKLHPKLRAGKIKKISDLC